jgi:hypothetical protein
VYTPVASIDGTERGHPHDRCDENKRADRNADRSKLPKRFVVIGHGDASSWAVLGIKDLWVTDSREDTVSVELICLDTRRTCHGICGGAFYLSVIVVRR